MIVWGCWHGGQPRISVLPSVTVEGRKTSTNQRAGGVALWARRDLGRRWRSLIALGLVAGLTAGLAMASFAAARRSATAFPRLREKTLSADAIVFPSQVGAFRPDWGPLKAKPYLTHLAVWNLSFGEIDGEPGGLLFIPDDEHWFGDVDRPVIIDGRLFDRAASDEMIVDEEAARQFGGVGTEIMFRPYAPGQDDTDPNQRASGPQIRLKVVGVVRETSQFLFYPGFAFPSPGVVARYGDQMSLLENAHVRLRNADTDMATLQNEVGEILAPGTPVLDLHAVEKRVATSIRVEELAQLILAGLVALAGLVFVGQALGRSASVIADSRRVLSAIGFTRGQLTWAATLPHLAVAATAALVAAATAVALSPRFPIGYAGRVDPDRGLNFDWVALVPGTLLVLVLVVGGAAATAWLRSRAARSPGRPGRFSTASWLRRLGPLPLAMGAGNAFESGRGRRGAAVRPALIGAFAGVLGIVGTLTIDHALAESLAHPERVGVTWQATVLPAADVVEPDGPAPEFVDRVAAHPEVGELSIFYRAVVDVGGVGVPTFSVDRVRGDIDLVALDGRAPVAEGEAAIGSATADDLGVDIGDEVLLGPKRVPVRIVGKALFPNDVHSGFTDGLWVNRSTFRTAVPTIAGEDEATSPTLNLRWRRGVDPEMAVDALAQELGPGALEVVAAEIPPELTNLRNVRVLPGLLAGFLALLALTTMAHGLMTTLRRRGHEFAVLRAIGFTRPMTGLMVGSHSTAVAVFGLLVGIPFGFAGGRAAWAWVAGQVPLRYVSPVTATVLVLLVPGSLLVANLLAAYPGWRVARLRPAEVLRTE